MEGDQQVNVGEEITADFFNRCVDEVAKNLIGCFLFVESEQGRVGGEIIDTEAYCQNDPAAHCHKNKDKRFNEGVCLFKNGTRQGSICKRMHDSMYRSGGHIYIYPNSKYCYLNFVCGAENFGSGVLIRGLKPSPASVDSMKRLRSRYASERRLRDLKNLCSGPNMLCQALGVTHDYDEQWLDNMNSQLRPLKLYKSTRSVRVICGSRIGLKGEAAKWPRRYVLDDCETSKFLGAPLESPKPLTPNPLAQLKTCGELSKCQCSSPNSSTSSTA